MDIYRLAKGATEMRLRELAATIIEGVLAQLEGEEMTESTKQQLLLLLGLSATGSVSSLTQAKSE